MARIDAILLRFEVRAQSRIRREIIRLWRRFNDLNAAIIEFERNITEILAGVYEETAEEYVPFVQGQLEGQGGAVATVAVLASLSAFYALRSQQAASEIVGTELTNIRDYARILAQEGMTQAEISAAIRARAPSYSVARADLIAQTEVFAVADEVTQRSLDESGLNFTEKEWITAGDSRVREDHRDVDGTRIPIDEDFRVGGERMRKPRDPRASAKQVLRCRCVVNYHI